jgi:putative component of membrane protein insertase Oxa1/YidC/SpoIIIJ protein YidD
MMQQQSGVEKTRQGLIFLFKILPKAFTVLCLFCIRFYQWVLSPMKDALFGPGCCRYEVSCSQYAWNAFQQYPAHKAFMISLSRLTSCHPWGKE